MIPKLSYVLCLSCAFLVTFHCDAQQPAVAWTLPPLPSGPLGDTIELGRELIERTVSHPKSKTYVGNALNCTSCHLTNGTDPRAASFIGIATAYPAWSPREERVITLEDRIGNCFMRSCHGVRPPLGSEVSVSIAAYITWLSSGQAIAMNAVRPLGPRAIPSLTVPAEGGNTVLGKALYERRCADCHGSDGQGDSDNPPVWGDRSFNSGAGLSKVAGLAAYLKVAMPLDETDLSDEDAIAIAAYVAAQPRLPFVLKDHLPAPNRLGEYNGKLD